jgi:hypothetical protein
LTDKIFDKYLETATDDWPWVEDQLTYANGKIAQAMILSGRSMGRSDILQAGLRSLKWLLEVQTDPKGHFVPVGNNGWYPRGGSKARFDQQPIEALNMIEACLEAFESTEDRKWISHAQKCFEWFLGRNDLNLSLYDHRTGGCCDGLQADGPNQNQGAESTLVCLLSILYLHRLRSQMLSAEAVGEIKSSEEVVVHGQ